MDSTHSVPQDVRMPLSSPMREEVLSPASPNVPQTFQRAQRKGLQGKRSRGSASPGSRRYSPKKPTVRPTNVKQETQSHQQRWPDLNVVTNFSKPPALAERAASSDRRQTAAAGAEIEGTEGEVLPKRKYSGGRKERKGSWHSKIPSQETNGPGNVQNEDETAAGLGLQPADQGDNKGSYSSKDVKGPISDLRRKSTWKELSPSDRLVAIGISITPTSVTERVSPEATRKSPGLQHHQYAVDRKSPGAPSILVTPVKDGAPWPASPNDRFTPLKPRPASSIYSQATQRGRAVTQPSQIPPVPMMPDASLYQRLCMALEPQITNTKLPARVVSTATIFDEDDVPLKESGARAYPPQLRILTRSSRDSMASRRSQGWWNFLMSPFSAKPNTPLFPSSSETRETVEVPSPQSSEATKIGEDFDEYDDDKKEMISPVGRRSAQSEKSHTSICTDDSRIERWRHANGLVFDDVSRASVTGPDRSRGLDHGYPEEPQTPEGFGAAAEYYRACWHDQNSPSPYFECQNHMCLPSKSRVLPSESERGSRVTDVPEEKTLGNSQDNVGSTSGNALGDVGPNEREALKSTAFQQTPSNRFSAAFKEAVEPKAKGRPVSDATEIEDVDTTPEVEEAHVAPIVRAAPPPPAPKDLPKETAVPVSKDPRRNPSAPTLDTEASRDVLDKNAAKPKSPVAEGSPPPVAKPSKRFVAVMPPEPEAIVSGDPTASKSKPSITSRKPIPPPSLAPVAKITSAQRDFVTTANETTNAESAPMDNQRPVYIVNHYHGDYRRPSSLKEPSHLSGLYPPPKEKSHTEANQESFRRREVDRQEKKTKKSTGIACLKVRSCFESDKLSSKKKKWLLIGIALALLIMIVIILSLALTLTGKGDNMPVQTQWLNISGFPPIPTGISTIIDPEAANEQSGCVSPTTLWSCALPKEEQPSIAPNALIIPISGSRSDSRMGQMLALQPTQVLAED